MGPLEQIDILLQALRPSEASNDRRKQICTFVEGVVQSLLPGVRLIGSGSYTSRTYLPTSDIDLVLFTAAPEENSTGIEMHYILQVFQALCIEISNRDSTNTMQSGSNIHNMNANASAGQYSIPMVIRNVEFINARTKVCHCIVNNIGIDITINQVGALKTVVFIEECDAFIGQNHLFKRSILLVKAWASCDSPCTDKNPSAADINNTEQSILGSKTGMLSSYAVSILVLYVLNRFPALNHPLSVLHAFLHTFAYFNWESNVVTVEGTQPIFNGQLRGDSSGEGKASSNTTLLAPFLAHFRSQLDSLTKETQNTNNSSQASSRSTHNPTIQRRFAIRSCNIQDPVDSTNNLGYSVSRNNLSILENCLRNGLRRLNEALVRYQIYTHVRPVLPETERGDIFNLSGFPGYNCHSHPTANTNMNSTCLTSEPSLIQEVSHNTHGASIALADDNHMTDTRFIESILPNTYKEYVSCLGVRADLLDHPLQGVSNVPLQHLNARYTSPIPNMQHLDAISSSPLEEHLRHLRIKCKSSLECALLGRVLDGNLSQLWVDLHAEYARRNGTFQYTRANNTITALMTPPVIMSEIKTEDPMIELSPTNSAISAALLPLTEPSLYPPKMTAEKTNHSLTDIAIPAMKDLREMNRPQSHIVAQITDQQQLLEVPIVRSLTDANDLLVNTTDNIGSMNIEDGSSDSNSVLSSPTSSVRSGVEGQTAVPSKVTTATTAATEGSPLPLSPTSAFHSTKRTLPNILRPPSLLTGNIVEHTLPLQASQTSTNPFNALISPTARTPHDVSYISKIENFQTLNPETFIEPEEAVIPTTKSMSLIKSHVMESNINQHNYLNDSKTGMKKKSKKRKSLTLGTTQISSSEHLDDNTELPSSVVHQGMISDSHIANIKTKSHWGRYDTKLVIFIFTSLVLAIALGFMNPDRVLLLLTRQNNPLTSNMTTTVSVSVSGSDPTGGHRTPLHVSNSGQPIAAASTTTASATPLRPRLLNAQVAHEEGLNDNIKNISEQVIAETSMATRDMTRLSLREHLSSKIATERRLNSINGYQYAHSSSVAPFTHWLKAGSSLSIGPNDISCPLNGVDLSAIYRAKRAYATALKERGHINITALLEASAAANGDEDLTISESQYQLLLGAFLKDIEVTTDSQGCARFSPEPKWVWQHNGIDIASTNGYIYNRESGYFEGGTTPILTIKNAQRILVDNAAQFKRDRKQVLDPQLTHEGIYSCVLRFGTVQNPFPGSRPPPTSHSSLPGKHDSSKRSLLHSTDSTEKTSVHANGAIKTGRNAISKAAAELEAMASIERSKNTYSSILSKDGHLLGYNNDLGLTFAMKNNFSVGENGGKGGKMMVQDDYFEVLVTQVAVRVSTMPVVTTKLTKGVHYELTEGQELFIGVNAESFPPPAFQWYQNGNKLEGEIRSFLQVVHVELEHAGAYTCEISNLAGSVIFEDVSVSVKKAHVHSTTTAQHVSSSEGHPANTPAKRAQLAQQEQERTTAAAQARQDALAQAQVTAQQSRVLRDELLKGSYPNLNSNPRTVSRKRREEIENETERTKDKERGTKNDNDAGTGTSSSRNGVLA